MFRALLTCAALVVGATAPAFAGLHLEPVPASGITILLFHQVSDHPVASTNGGEDTIKRPWVDPRRFDAILGEAERAGYRYVTEAQAERFFLHGDRAGLPAKPLLLTFDDGYRNAWLEATPVLRAHHATATMFFEGVLTDVKPERLTTADLKAMVAGGVWTLASHGWMGHSNVRLDAAGTLSPYWYANLAWLPEAGRLETPAELGARVRADLEHFRARFEPTLGVPLRAFAFPSGEFGQSGPLEPGGDAATRVVGHSNAAGLEPVILGAVRAAGMDLAFGVSVPGVTTPASLADDRYALPRLGAGADFSFPTDVVARWTAGTRLPEIAHDRYSDPGALAATPDGFYVASSTGTRITSLARDGRERAHWDVPELLQGRGTRPSLVAGLVAEGTTVVILQQAGLGDGAVPTLTMLDLSGPSARVVARRAVARAIAWPVGMVRLGSRLVALTDDGTFFDVADGTQLSRIALPEGAKRHDRFVGPVVIDGAPYVVDDIDHRLVRIGRDGAQLDAVPFTGNVHHVAAFGDRLFAVNADDDRHILDEYRVSAG